MSEFISFLGNLVTAGATIGIVLAAIARLIPNEKLYGFGVKSGQFLDSIGSTKLGFAVWEKIEDFLVNSIGEYLKGLRFGLDNKAPIVDGDNIDDDIRT